MYVNEAEVLKMALFGMTARDWREANPGMDGNIRDYADVSHLVCLANLETLNAQFIQQGAVQSERLILLNRTAIHQMKILTADTGVKRLEDGDE